MRAYEDSADQKSMLTRRPSSVHSMRSSSARGSAGDPARSKRRRGLRARQRQQPAQPAQSIRRSGHPRIGQWHTALRSADRGRGDRRQSHATSAFRHRPAGEPACGSDAMARRATDSARTWYRLFWIEHRRWRGAGGCRRAWAAHRRCGLTRRTARSRRRRAAACAFADAAHRGRIRSHGDRTERGSVCGTSL